MALTQARLHEALDYDPATGIFRWRQTLSNRAKAGSIAGASSHGYVCIRVDGILYPAHRLAWLHAHGEWPCGEIDHLNMQRGDNRLDNLRDVERFVNLQNRRIARSDNELGVLGVCRTGRKYRASIRLPNGIAKHLGTFETPEAAHAAYISEKRRVHEGCTL